jgi:hypothetical protein
MFTKILLITSILTAFTSATDVVHVTGKGKIVVLKGFDINHATSAQQIGCINSSGQVSAVDCAIFTTTQTSTTTEKGICGFVSTRDSTSDTEHFIYKCGPGVKDTYSGFYIFVSPSQLYAAFSISSCYYHVKYCMHFESSNFEDRKTILSYS